MTLFELGWMQRAVLYILGTLTSGIVWLCVCKYCTKHGEREVELEGIQIGTDTGTHSFEGEPPSELISLLRGGDDEGRPPLNDALEAIVFTALPCRSFERKPSSSPGCKRLRSNCRSTLKPPSMKKSRGMDVVPQTESSQMLRRREQGSDGADPATPWVSSTTAGGYRDLHTDASFSNLYRRMREFHRWITSSKPRPSCKASATALVRRKGLIVNSSH